MENITSQINDTSEKIHSLDNKINTDDELITHSQEIKGIYNNIQKIDDSIKQINGDEDKQNIKQKIFEIKQLFADLLYNGKIDQDTKSIEQEMRFDWIIDDYIINLNDIIGKNFDKIDIPKINIEEVKNKLLNTELTYEQIKIIDEGLSDEEKITLLTELSNEGICSEDISFLAIGFGFKSGVLSVGEDGDNKLSYVVYGSGCMIIDGGDIVYGKDYEEAYMKYLSEHTEVTDTEIKIKFGKFGKSTIYTISTDDIETKDRLNGTLHNNIKNGKNPDVYEFIHKFGFFTKIELNGGKDSIKAELYNKFTTGGLNFKLGLGTSLSYIHKGNGITSTTSVGVSANLGTFSSQGPQWNPSSVEFNVTQDFEFFGRVSLNAGASYDISKKKTSYSASVGFVAYQTSKTKLDFLVGNSAVGFSFIYNF